MRIERDKRTMCKELERSQIIAIIEAHGKTKEGLLSILLEIQNSSGENYVHEQWAKLVAEQLGLPYSKVYDVLTFYAMFSTKPRGKYVIEVCKSTPCHVSKAYNIVKILENELGINIGNTTEDKLFTLQYTSCVGACDIGPIMKIGEDVYGNLTADKITELINTYRGGLQCQK